MKITSWLKEKNTVYLNTTDGKMKIVPYSDRTLRVVYTLKEDFGQKESLSVIQKQNKNISIDVDEDENKIVIKTNALRLNITKSTGRFQYFNSTGNLLMQEPENGGKTLTPIEVKKARFHSVETNAEVQTVDGVKSYIKETERVFDRMAYHTKLEFSWAPGEALYGLGQYEEGILNLRGQHRYMYQNNLMIVLPLLLSTKGYGVLWDSYSDMEFRDDETGSYLWTDVDDEMDFYFIYGPDFDKIIREYRNLTGAAALLPMWAFGYIQSKERYRTQQEILEIAEEYRKRQIPIDGIVQDWHTWSEGLWGEKIFDPERYPQPEVMMQKLHEKNIHLMLSIWANMGNGGANHEEMKSHGFLLGNQLTYNAFDEHARNLYWKQTQEGLFSKGIDAWWSDCTEPFESDWHGETKPKPEERRRLNVEEAQRYLDPEYVNAYSLLHTKGLYEGQRSATNDKRVCILTRSSYAGQHRYGTICWSGDISASWETLHKQIAEGLNFCAAGEPYWNLDIGAFFVKSGKQWFWKGEFENGCEDLGYRELYTRWLQFGAFLPMFRSHGTDTPREVWRFGNPGEIFYDSILKFIRLRYRLINYIYSLAYQVTLDGYTIMRALPFDFRMDSRTYNIKDQYMFGPALMVCPVTKPMYYLPNSEKIDTKQKNRKVYLPDNCIWYDFWTEKQYSGGQTLTAEADISIMPLYVPAGTILPFGIARQYAEENPTAPLTLKVYPGRDGEFTLYFDEGDNYNYEKGAFEKIHLSWNDSEETLLIDKREGSYPGMPETRKFIAEIIGRQTKCEIDYNGNSMRLALNKTK